MSVLLATTFVEVMEWIGYILVALLCLMFMIVVHEFGHFILGRAFGFKIDQFAVGFGPAILKYTSKKSGTMFALRCIPLGGYCAFHGEGEARKKKKQQTVDYLNTDGTAVVKQDIAIKEQDNPKKKKKKERLTYINRAENFDDNAPWKRIIVFFAGAAFNLISCVILVTIFFMAYGDFVPKVGTAAELTRDGIKIEQVLEDGDIILKVDGKGLYSTLNANDFAEKLNKAGDGVVVTVRRDGEVMDLTLHTGDFSYIDADGNVASAHGFGMTDITFEREKFGFFKAFGRSFVFIFKAIGVLFITIGQVFTGALGLGEAMGGTITAIGTIASLSRGGFEMVLYAVCVLSASLAVMNLLPLPSLDGSHIIFTAIEWMRGRPINKTVENVIHTVGLVALLTFAIVLDVVHFLA